MTQDNGGQLHVGQIVRIMRRRWRVIATSALAFTVLAVTIGVLVPPRYTARTQLVLDPHVAERESGYDDAAVETWVELLISPSHLRRLRDSLAADPVRPARTEFARPIMTVAAESAWRYLTGKQPASPAVEADRAVLAAQMPDLEDLERKLKSFKERRSRVVAVTFTWTDPDLAAAIANRSMAIFLDEALELRRRSRDRNLEALRQRIPQARADLSRTETALAAYRIAHGLADTDRIDQIDSQIAEVNRQIAIASSGLAAYRSSSGPGSLVPIKNGGPADALHNPGPVQATDADVAVLEARMRYFAGRLTALQEASTQARNAEARLRELRLEATTSAKLYEALLQQEAELRDNPIQPEAKLVAIADPPELPSSPDPIFLVPPALVAGAIAGGMLAILRERTDRRVHSEGEVEAALGMRCIGVVPRARRIGRLRSLRALLLEPFAPYTKAIRSVAVSVLGLPAERQAGKVILFTSSLDQEGKTSLAVGFAAYTVLLRRSVLVIDFDLRHPGIGRLLGAAEGPGVPEVLQGMAPTEAIRSNQEFGIDYLPLSCRQLDPVLLMADKRVRELLDEMRSRYDCIVIDGPPLIGNAEARVLVALADHVILALKWGSTELDTAQAAMREIRKAGEPASVGVVLTQVDLRRHAAHGSAPGADPGAGDPVRWHPAAPPDRSGASV